MPRKLRRFIIGHNGKLKRKLEEETNCKLIFPSKKNKNHPVGWFYIILRFT